MRVSSRLFLVLAFCLVTSAAAGRDLSRANAEADKVHSNGKTALMVAAREGDTGRMRRLIGQGADVNRANNNGGTPIMYAALSGDPDAVDLLLRHGANVNAVAVNGWTALMVAAAKGYVDVVELLLARGASPDQADVYSWTPLMRAVNEDRPRIVRALLDKGRADVNRPGENGLTALHLAVLKKDPVVVRLLMAAGADPDITDDTGRTPVDFAKENNDLSMLDLIRTRAGE